MKTKPRDANDILREHGPEALREQIDNATGPKLNGDRAASRFNATRFENIRLNTSPGYLVKGIIPRDGLAFVYGPPKCGKSFWAYDLMMHVALGWPYRGHRVRQGPVLYCALEGVGHFANRVEAWRRRHLNGHTDSVPFYLIAASFGLVADHDELIATIREQIADAPAAVVIDTLNRAMDGDENKSEDMRRFICAADKIYAAFGCVVIIIHHCGIAGSRPRGHTSLDGANAAQIAVAHDDEGRITATVEYMKDGQTGAVITSKLDVVKLGRDNDGDEITSCIVVEAEPADPADNLTGNNALAYRALRELSDEGRHSGEAGTRGPSSAKLVLQLAWRNRFFDLHSGDKQDTKKRAFNRAQVDLEKLKLIGFWHEFVYLRDKRDKEKN